jgi:hypothetical protein
VVVYTGGLLPILTAAFKLIANLLVLRCSIEYERHPKLGKAEKAQSNYKRIIYKNN